MAETKTDTTYQGWTNHSTWCVNLWLNNDQCMYDGAFEVVDPGEDYEAAERLKEWVSDQNPLAEAPTMWADLLGAALEDVNWIEIVHAIRG